MQQPNEIHGEFKDECILTIESLITITLEIFFIGPLNKNENKNHKL